MWGVEHLTCKLRRTIVLRGNKLQDLQVIPASPLQVDHLAKLPNVSNALKAANRLEAFLDCDCSGCAKEQNFIRRHLLNDELREQTFERHF